jgi:hypothetical protein
VCNVLGDATGAAIVQHLCQDDLAVHVSASTDASCEKTCRDRDQGRDQAVAASARDANSGIAPGGGGERERERERESHPLPVEGLAPELSMSSTGMTPSCSVRFSKVLGI